MLSRSTDSGDAFIFDADVLIDLVMADRHVLTLTVKHLAPVYIVSPVLRQLREIQSRDQMIQLGVTIIDPDVEDLYQAANIQNPSKYVDYVCLLTAKRRGFICVANDIELRKRCKCEGVRCMREFRLLILLHKAGGISTQNAINLAEEIHKSNPKYITRTILADFMKEIRLAGDRHGH